MTILVGIAAYFAFALFVGRFLSLSTRGETAFVLPAAAPASTERMRRAERPAAPNRTASAPAGPPRKERRRGADRAGRPARPEAASKEEVTAR